MSIQYIVQHNKTINFSLNIIVEQKLSNVKTQASQRWDFTWLCRCEGLSSNTELQHDARRRLYVRVTPSLLFTHPHPSSSQTVPVVLCQLSLALCLISVNHFLHRAAAPLRSQQQHCDKMCFLLSG